MDTQETIAVNNSIIKYRSQEKINKDRADDILKYQRLVGEFEAAINQSGTSQVVINSLRKRVNNARMRITPWLIKEKTV